MFQANCYMRSSKYALHRDYALTRCQPNRGAHRTCFFFPQVQLVVPYFSFNSPVVRVFTRNSSLNMMQLIQYVYSIEYVWMRLLLCVAIKLKVTMPIMLNWQETTMTKVSYFFYELHKQCVFVTSRTCFITLSTPPGQTPRCWEIINHPQQCCPHFENPVVSCYIMSI